MDKHHILILRAHTCRGAVLIPVLLFASMITLGILILLQSQVLQKKSLGEFKEFLQNRNALIQQKRDLEALPLEALNKITSWTSQQKIPATLHHQNQLYHFYFHNAEKNTIYKLGAEQYTAEIDKLNIESGFQAPVFYQAVGNPMDSIYVIDKIGLYKITFGDDKSFIKQLLTFGLSSGLRLDDPSARLTITRDARGDGRLIRFGTWVYHEPSDKYDQFLEAFEHYDYSTF